MFDISGDDVARLSDADLRTLSVRLALAELQGKGLPRSAVIAGGHQDAKDGGIDVRVSVAIDLGTPGFIPRAQTGFQVKKPDMAASAINTEMRPNGVLRPAIAELAQLGGAYVIVSAQGSVTDSALADRLKAMRTALDGCADAGKLKTDFYDRERLAVWTNTFPGAAAWVRGRIGGGMSGWGPMRQWANTATDVVSDYVVSEDAYVSEEKQGSQEKLAIPEALDYLRALLSQPRQCVRLIGMSGVGKTRFVEAMFEGGIGGGAPLDPALSVYTDFSADITPSANEMARRLVDAGHRAILIVDNCKPDTHGDLVKICSAPQSRVSLLTVEYDVRDDVPEHTDVFRLTTGAGAAIEHWLEREFPHVSQVDRKTISDFSDGNFRVARALAETVRHGEALGRLRSEDLFARIFVQRNAPDGALLHNAEILALVYSFDALTDGPTSELAILADFAGRTARELFAAITTLRDRGVVQSRGRWRAVLPQAIANRLAAGALAKMRPADMDEFARQLPPRLAKSFSRRLGYLHDCPEASALVSRCLGACGPFGNLFDSSDDRLAILLNIAPAAPKAVLNALGAGLEPAIGLATLVPQSQQRHDWHRLLKALAYDAELFQSSALALARFVAAESPEHNTNSAVGMFEELFHLYISGTHALPAARRCVVRKLISDPDAGLRKAGELALRALLKAEYFSSTSTFDFGARSRDYGWQPETGADVFSWYDEAVTLALDMSAHLPTVKSMLGGKVRGLLRVGCIEAVERIRARFAVTGGWVDGWIGLRATLRYDGNGMPEDVRDRLVALIEATKPIDIIDRARAYVLGRASGGYDVADSEDDDPSNAYEAASRTAQEIGQAMATLPDVLDQFLPEVMGASGEQRGFVFGRGIGLSAPDLPEIWEKLVGAFREQPSKARNGSVLGGFVCEGYQRDPGFTDALLERALTDACLLPDLPYLQSAASLDDHGVDRLTRLASTGGVAARAYWVFQLGTVRAIGAEALVRMLEAVADLEDGVSMAVEALYMWIFCSKQDGVEVPYGIVTFGRSLLRRLDVNALSDTRDHSAGELSRICLSGPEAEDDARGVCQQICQALVSGGYHARDCSTLTDAIFSVQPEVALDCFLADASDRAGIDFFRLGFFQSTPLEKLPAKALCDWADHDPADRYARLGNHISPFAFSSTAQAACALPLFFEVLSKAKDVAAFLGHPMQKISPPYSFWSGSRVSILEGRKGVISQMTSSSEPVVKVWAEECLRLIDNQIIREREFEIEREESFE
jgi:hypothetical protein